jgi:ABC-type antimicrobial peptide transport system permease subunit
MGWKEAVGQEFLLDSVKHYVIGVVHDFYYDDFHNPVDPVVFTLTEQDQFIYMVLKAQQGKIMAAEQEVKDAWRKVAPDDPNAVRFQSSVFDNFMRNNRGNDKLMLFIAGASIFLAAMGLYGLVSYNLTRRLKEFSIRKVFGASVSQIFRLMSKDYLVILIIAFSLGAPAGALLMNSLLVSIYPTKIPANLIPYGISILVMLLMIAVTVLLQFRRVVRENPTETLKVD